jgi:hypothetical protein
MPALFAYVIAVGLLLGGGYGALSWLAAPEPVKVAAKAKAKPPPRYDYGRDSYGGNAEPGAAAVSASAAIPPAVSNSDRAASAADVDPPSSGTNVAASEQGAQEEASRPVQDQQSRSAAEAPAVEKQPPPTTERQQPKQAAELPAQASSPSPASPGNRQTAAAKMPKRQHPRQANGRSEPALALMTLRTIEFSDGRRVSQLIPIVDPSAPWALGLTNSAGRSPLAAHVLTKGEVAAAVDGNGSAAEAAG